MWKESVNQASGFSRKDLKRLWNLEQWKAPSRPERNPFPWQPWICRNLGPMGCGCWGSNIDLLRIIHIVKPLSWFPNGLGMLEEDGHLKIDSKMWDSSRKPEFGILSCFPHLSNLLESKIQRAVSWMEQRTLSRRRDLSCLQVTLHCQTTM